MGARGKRAKVARISRKGGVRPRPTFAFESAALEQTPGAVIAGVDEAGCAPLAGPVVAAAVVLDQKNLPQLLADELNDSKKVAKAKRETLFALLHTCGAVIIGVGRAEVHEIDTLNILRAAHLAMARAVENLGCAVNLALVDGNRKPPLPCDVQTIVGGDGKSLSIAAASIVAKVTRDRLMADLAALHPGYGWETNVGYPTAAHFAALKRLGVTAHHRRSFAPVRAVLGGAAAE